MHQCCIFYINEIYNFQQELGLCIEKLSKELYERKNALDDADTEVFIVQVTLPLKK